jgi:hypothetical protein
MDTSTINAETRRRRAAWRPLAAAVLGGAALLTTGFGVWASLTATAANVAPETVSTGTLKLTLADNGAGFTQAISNVAPGDVVNRYVTLTNGGTLDAQALSVQVAATGSSSLITDGASPATTKALRVTMTACSVAWNPTTGACGGVATQVLAPTALSGLSTPSTLVAGSVSAAAVQNLQVSVQLPDQNETTVNGVLPTSTVQGQSASLTYTFAEAQRTATTTKS